MPPPPPSETVNLPPPPTLSCTPFVQEGDSKPPRETAVRDPQESPSLGRRTASPHTPHSPGNRGRKSDGCVGNRKRQETVTLLHKTESVPHLRDPDNSLNGAVSLEVPLVAETAPLHRALLQRGSPQSTLGDWDAASPPQRADMPPEVTQDLRAEPVSTDGVKELQYLQENLPGVVADVYRAVQEGRRPSGKQRRQGCAEWQLYCRHWNSLQIGPDGLLVLSWAANHNQPIQEGTFCLSAIRKELVEEVHQQAHEEAQQVLTELQLWWYWPDMEREVRRIVRQCGVCQASKHGRPPDRVGQRRQSPKGSWQLDTADLADHTHRRQPKAVAWQEKPPPFMKMSSPPAAFKLPSPLPRSETDLEVQNPPTGRSPYGDTRKAPCVTN